MPSMFSEGDVLKWVRRRRGASWEVCLLTPRGDIWFLGSDRSWSREDVLERGGEFGEDVAIPTPYASELWGGADSDLQADPSIGVRSEFHTHGGETYHAHIWTPWGNINPTDWPPSFARFCACGAQQQILNGVAPNRETGEPK